MIFLLRTIQYLLILFSDSRVFRWRLPTSTTISYTLLTIIIKAITIGGITASVSVTDDSMTYCLIDATSTAGGDILITASRVDIQLCIGVIGVSFEMKSSTSI